MFQGSEKSFNCKECDASFSTRGKLQYHNYSIHVKFETIKCDQFNKVLTNLAQFRNHVNKCLRSKQETQNCNKCEATFTNQKNLDHHYKTTHFDLTNKTCEFCDKIFSNISKYESHVRSSHMVSKRFECDHCEASFPSNSALKEHVTAFHENKKLFKCDCCDQEFGYRSHLWNHMKNIHNSKTNETISCP